MKVGDRVKQKINYGGEGGSLLPAQEGTVVYVHPEGRFYTLEFTFPSPWGVRKIREAYPLPPDPARLAPAKDPLRHESGSHYKWDARAAMGRYLESDRRKSEKNP